MCVCARHLTLYNLYQIYIYIYRCLCIYIYIPWWLHHVSKLIHVFSDGDDDDDNDDNDDDPDDGGKHIISPGAKW